MAGVGILEGSRRRIIPDTAKTKGSEAPLTFTFLKAGMLAGFWLSIRGNITSAGLSNLNPLGKASIIRRVEVFVNGGQRLHSFSGAGYHYLIRDHLEGYQDVVSQSDARSAVAVGNYNLDMYVPLAVNLRDAIGLFMLQSEQAQVVCTVDFEADANIATGITAHTCTVKPTLVAFSVPRDESKWPDFSVLHSIIEQTQGVSALGEFPYTPIRGQTYLQLLAAYGIGVAGSDKWASAQLNVLGTDQVEKWTPNSLDAQFSLTHGRARLPGTIPLDWLGSSGLGAYGSARDALASGQISDIQLTVDITAQPDTFYAVRRQLIQLTA
jgi:hypothetical protein